jgi:dienelactone hydrolase
MRSLPFVLPPNRLRRSCVLLTLALAGCFGALQLEESDHPVVLSRQVMQGPSPSAPGDHAVQTLFYGSGTDKNRPEYRDSVAFTTDSVDASKLIDLGGQADDRNGYWGFTPEGFPLNARVWYPGGPGPYPLVLVVHGNHDPRDFSDPGYDYLGELLASRGYILASIDMNFVNGGVRQENDARGWLLLKHVEAFGRFNTEEGNPFYGKVDMSAISLMGHSRGGEAVGHAAAFNRLTHYPDDASERFDFGFDIKSIVSIAPVDGQYRPTDRHVPLEDVSFLVFHGSHDGDVTSFHGLRMYDRLRFTDGEPRLKTAIYVYRANHGQWNSVWGPHDSGPRSGRRLDLRGLMPTEDQKEFARIYVSAFLDYTLKGDTRYLPLFRDHRVAGDWLPKTMYVTRFQDASFRSLADFEGDIDVTTGSVPEVRLQGDSLSTWKEGMLALRSSNRPTTSSSQDNQAVWLGWNNEVQGSDEPGPPAAFRILLPDTLAGAWGFGDEASLELSLSATESTPGPRASPDTTTADEEEEEDPREASREDEEEDEEGEDEEEPIDLSVVLVDASGGTAAVPLSDYGPIRWPLETRILRRGDQEERFFPSLSELVLQSYSIPLSDFEGVDLGSVTEVRLVFDRSPKGEVVVDDLGIAWLDPAYTAARMPRTGG